MPQLFQWSAHNPFHISVGALVVNEKGEICTHHYVRSALPERYTKILGALDDAYILMRESLENNETIEGAVHRGLREEFGMEGEIVRYLGSIQCTFTSTRDGTQVEKTTLYFHVRLTEQSERPMDDAESFSELAWMASEVLIEKMRAQGKALTRGDMDESKIVAEYVAQSLHM